MSKRVAIITGASSGLGRELALRLADEKYFLVLNARRPSPLETITSEIASRTEVVSVVGDVSEVAEEIAAVARSRFGQIDLLINNASEIEPTPLPLLEEIEWEALLRLYRVNAVAPLHLTQLVLPMLRESNGVIVNISSDAGVNAYPRWGGYGSSKAALEHLSRTLAAELEGIVRVLVVDPGDMNTPMHRAAVTGDLSHLPSPDVVAPVIVELIRSGAPYRRVEAQSLLEMVDARR